MTNDKHARLVYLSDALSSLAMLTFAADQWLSPETCDVVADELEPMVLATAAQIEVHVPELVLPFSLECDERIDEIVEFELGNVKEKLARVDKIKAAFGAKARA